MASLPEHSRIARFGIFEVDLQARELRKAGLKIRLHYQPFQVLIALIERPGEVVTREELRKRIWPGGTFVDFDSGLNTAVNRLREALGDSAENPRFVETLSRRGYRFLAPVEDRANKEAAGIEENSPGAVERAEQPALARRSRWRWQLLPWALVVTLSLAVVFLATAYFRRPSRDAHLVRFQIPLPEHLTFDFADFPVISPNGERLVIAGRGSDGKRHLWVRSLDSNSFQLLAESQEYLGRPGEPFPDLALPFWSPDSRSVAYFCNRADAGGRIEEIRRVDLTSGLIETVCKLESHYAGGGAWSRDGVILVSTGTDHTLYRVSAAGGELKPALAADKSLPYNDFPQFLPDGRHFLYCSKKETPPVGKTAIYVASLDSPEPKILIPADSNASYAPPGFVIFGLQESLFAQLFDAASLKLVGRAVALREPVAGWPTDCILYFSVSENGVLVYRDRTLGELQLAWYNRAGTRQESVGEPGLYSYMNAAPDARRLAVHRSDPETRTPDIWSLELTNGILTRVTSSGGAFPIMSPDGREVVFSSDREGRPWGLYRKKIGGTAEELLLESNEWPVAQHWLRDGSILFSLELPHTNPAKGDFYRLPTSGARKPVLLFETAFAKRSARVSSDGRWVAYQSDASGRWEVYLAAFPSFTENRQVSVGGGCQPVWREDDKELFYLSLAGKLMSIDVRSAKMSETSVPRMLFQVPFQVDERGRQYSVSGDGAKFLFAEQVERTSPPITVVLNWTSGLKR